MGVLFFVVWHDCRGARATSLKLHHLVRLCEAYSDYGSSDWPKDRRFLVVEKPVGGESAGGNLAAVVPLMARDKGGPGIVYQVMVYPVTERNFNTESYSSNADGYGLTHPGMAWYWDHYMAKDNDAENPYAAPMKAADLSGLPPAMVITAEYDPLRDEGEAYAARLQAAGVPTVCTRYDGQIHLFYALPDLIDAGAKAVAQACGALKAAFAGQAVAADD